MDDRIYDIWLTTVEGLGPSSQFQLLNFFGSSRAVFEQDKSSIEEALLMIKHVDKTFMKNLMQKNLKAASSILTLCNKSNINIVDLNNISYPSSLLDLCDPPLVLYYIGELLPADSPSIAVVGARKATAYGRWAAFSIGEKLGQYNITVVSGMAYGVDCAAHKGALSAKGRTIAVFGCGPDICYPNTHRELMDAIIQNGAVVSEFPPGTPPMAHHFPRRNRLISGMSKSIIIAEAGLSSGSLITAEYALEQGKDIFAVPGNINSAYSVGTNKLIRDGAAPVTDLEDLIWQLGFEQAEHQKTLEIKLGKDEILLYNAIKEQGVITADGLARTLCKTLSETQALLTILEIKGLVQIGQGKIFIAK
jgi:DNA processing protein